MKKLLLGLGSIAAVATPVITVIACGNDDPKSDLDFANAEQGKINKLTSTSEDVTATVVTATPLKDAAAFTTFGITYEPKPDYKYNYIVEDDGIKITVAKDNTWATTAAEKIPVSFVAVPTDVELANKEQIVVNNLKSLGTATVTAAVAATAGRLRFWTSFKPLGIKFEPKPGYIYTVKEGDLDGVKIAVQKGIDPATTVAEKITVKFLPPLTNTELANIEQGKINKLYATGFPTVNKITEGPLENAAAFAKYGLKYEPKDGFTYTVKIVDNYNIKIAVQKGADSATTESISITILFM